MIIENRRKLCKNDVNTTVKYIHSVYVYVCSDSIIGVVIDIHPADQFSHQLLHSIRAQPANLQDALMVHTVTVFVTLHHLSQTNQSISQTTNQSVEQSIQHLPSWPWKVHFILLTGQNPSIHWCIDQCLYLVGDQREAKDSQTAVSRYNDLRSRTHTCKHTTHEVTETHDNSTDDTDDNTTNTVSTDTTTVFTTTWGVMMKNIDSQSQGSWFMSWLNILCTEDSKSTFVESSARERVYFFYFKMLNFHYNL